MNYSNYIIFAYCTFCKEAFRIDGSGESQVSSYHKSRSVKNGEQNTKKKPAIDPNQRVFQPNLDAKISMSEKTSLPPNHAGQVSRAEIYQTLHVAHSNCSFASTQGYSKRFKLMFPNCPIAQSYAQADAKLKCNLQFGIAPYSKEQLIYDVKRSPFTFKFDESTTRFVDEQYDGYIQYLSESEHNVLSRYSGSLFLGHCTSDDLVDHFKQFVMDNELDPN